MSIQVKKHSSIDKNFEHLPYNKAQMFLANVELANQPSKNTFSVFNHMCQSNKLT